MVAASADICLKPWNHAVVIVQPSQDVVAESDSENLLFSNFPLDLIMRIECRDKRGNRFSDNDLELEIYRSGKEINLMLSWVNQSERPLLWHSKHSVWMDGNTGQRCDRPKDGDSLESLARRTRSIFD